MLYSVVILGLKCCSMPEMLFYDIDEFYMIFLLFCLKVGLDPSVKISQSVCVPNVDNRLLPKHLLRGLWLKTSSSTLSLFSS